MGDLGLAAGAAISLKQNDVLWIGSRQDNMLYLFSWRGASSILDALLGKHTVFVTVYLHLRSWQVLEEVPSREVASGPELHVLHLRLDDAALLQSVPRYILGGRASFCYA